MAWLQKFGLPDRQYVQVPSTLPLGLIATLWPTVQSATPSPTAEIMQIAAADAAQIDFDKDLIGSQVRTWTVL